MNSYRFGIFGPLQFAECIFKRGQYFEIKRFFSESYYDILKVPKSCTSKEIREAFINLSKQSHPDKHQNDPTMHNRFVKINEAYSVLVNPTSRKSYDISLETNKRLKDSSTRKFYSSTFDNGFKDPFMWGPQSRDTKFEGKSYYGIKGIKRVSNTVILLVLFFITVFGVGLQFLAIRSSFLRSHEQMLEQTRKYSMIHSLAREKAKLYGNAHQIEVLKKSLTATCGDVQPVEEELEEILQKLIPKQTHEETPSPLPPSQVNLRGD